MPELNQPAELALVGVLAISLVANVALWLRHRRIEREIEPPLVQDMRPTPDGLRGDVSLEYYAWVEGRLEPVETFQATMAVGTASDLVALAANGAPDFTLIEATPGWKERLYRNRRILEQAQPMALPDEDR